MEPNTDFWRKCSACKKPIGFNQQYYVCSVSTCNGQRTGYVFCSVFCWDVHVPGANHKSAGAVEKTSPSRAAVSAAAQAGAAVAARRIVPASQIGGSASAIPKDILIVASKLKDYIRAKSDMNTSAEVMTVLSDIVRRECDAAIEKAKGVGRKTVLDRDFED